MDLNPTRVGMEARQPQVMDAMQRLEATIGRLEATSERIEERLTPVLRQPEPTTKGEGEKLAGAPVPLVADLSNHSHAIQAVTDRLNNVLDRLEL